MSVITPIVCRNEKTAREKIKRGKSRQPRLPWQLAAGLLTGGMFLLRPAECARAAAEGLALCARGVIPGVFPMMAVCCVLTGAGAAGAARRLFGKPFARLFGIRGAGAAALLTGLVCGFPAGAAVSGELYREKELTAEETAALLGFCTYPSAAFLVNVAGGAIWGSRAFGAVLYGCTAVSGLLWGLLGGVVRRRTSAPVTAAPAVPSRSAGEGGGVPGALERAARSMLSVCGCVVFFSCVGGCLNALTGLSAGSFPAAWLSSLLELTSGAAACAAAETGTGAAAVLCAAAAGWSGLSVQLQTRAVCPDVPMAPYRRARLGQAALSALLMAVTLRLFPSLLPASAFPAVTVQSLVFLPAYAVYPAAFTAVCIVLFFACLCFPALKKLDIRRRV